MMETKEIRMRRGWITFGILAILTAVEFAIATAMENALTLLMIIALLKAGLIIIYFMRFSDLSILWSREAGE